MQARWHTGIQVENDSLHQHCPQPRPNMDRTVAQAVVNRIYARDDTLSSVDTEMSNERDNVLGARQILFF